MSVHNSCFLFKLNPIRRARTPGCKPNVRRDRIQFLGYVTRGSGHDYPKLSGVPLTGGQPNALLGLAWGDMVGYQNKIKNQPNLVP